VRKYFRGAGERPKGSSRTNMKGPNMGRERGGAERHAKRAKRASVVGFAMLHRRGNNLERKKPEKGLGV